jgi:hypothetical protein
MAVAGWSTPENKNVSSMLSSSRHRKAIFLHWKDSLHRTLFLTRMVVVRNGAAIGLAMIEASE